MKATFTKTHSRRYRVSVDGPGLTPSYMEPAPGFDDRLPHDAAHFIVENELGIMGGVFGQLASGGTAITFLRDEDTRSRRKAGRKGSKIAKENADDAHFSEHAVFAAQSRWEKSAHVPPTDIPDDAIERIVEAFDAFAARWRSLPVGGSITLEWNPKPKPGRK